MINKRTLTALNKYLSKKDIRRLQKNADKVNEIEQRHQLALEKMFKELNERIEREVLTSGKLPNLEHIDFELFFGNMLFQVLAEGVKETESGDIEVPKKEEKRLAKKDRWRMPRSFKDLMNLYDDFRKERRLPSHIKKIADSVKKEYLKKTQSVWQKYSKDFLQGGIQEKKEVVEKIKKIGDTTKARANTIVNTETTKYYNQVRKNIYDQSPDVTHYLFVAIRDAVTTKWCKTRNGIVYKKGEKITHDETPAIHWNCRSEFLPLTPQNPNHLKLINDKSKWRENRHPEPLPKGWHRNA